MRAERKHNLRDVARHAGVSVATVSRVMNRPAQVAEDTRARVEKAMEVLRFRPSAAARAINSGRSRVVAALLPTLDNAIYARLVDGLESSLSVHDLSLIVAQTQDDPGIKLARAKQLLSIGAEGFIVAGITHGPEFDALMAYHDTPVIAVSYHAPDHHSPTIGYDNREATLLAAQHLTALEHRRIAVLHGPLATNDRTAQRHATLTALDGEAIFDFYEVEISMGGGAEGVERMLADGPEATAVLCFSDVLAMGALNALSARGFRVPEDYSVMGIENLPGASVTNPPLTSVRLQIERMGQMAADAVAGWLDDGVRPTHVRLDVELMARASTGAPRA